MTETEKNNDSQIGSNVLNVFIIKSKRDESLNLMGKIP